MAGNSESGAGGNVVIRSGSGASNAHGEILFQNGVATTVMMLNRTAVSVNSLGAIQLVAGNASNSSNGAAVTVSGGTSADGIAGNVVIGGGDDSASGIGGDVVLRGGYSAAGSKGTVQLQMVVEQCMWRWTSLVLV